jgi:SagB-type dehydrogenase family enzyme
VSRSRRSRRATVRFRRSPHLVSYWRQGSLLLVNYATRQTASADPLIFEILNFCTDWRTLEDVDRAVGPSPATAVLLDGLVRLSLLQRSDRPVDAATAATDTLGPWHPEVGFFHTATKDVQFWSVRQSRRHAKASTDRTPMPARVKRYARVPTVALPPIASTNAFTDVLLARRTSRRYSTTPVTIQELSSLLAFTIGVQQWARTNDGEVPLKTSPSGGARHPIECYVVARDVAGLKPAIYHYACDRHVLERIHGPVSRERIRAYVPESGYFAKASAMVFFTAVFVRQLWRYPYSRAYRAALVEAGHVCQTFLLTATSLGLAPYCVMGLADTLVEGDLGIDGITESVLYCAGVGRLPRGSQWAALPHGTLKTRQNKHLLPRR